MVEYERKQVSLAVYTRRAVPGVYPDGLARSVHFAVSRDGKTYEPWNSGYGILFAEGTITEQNTIRPKCVKDPHLSRRKDGSFAITARRVEEDGSEDEESRGKVLLWLTEDFIHFTACGLVAENGLLEEREGTDRLMVDAAVCGRAALYW